MADKSSLPLELAHEFPALVRLLAIGDTTKLGRLKLLGALTGVRKLPPIKVVTNTDTLQPTKIETKFSPTPITLPRFIPV